MQKKHWGWIAAAGVVLAALVWAFAPRPLLVETAVVRQGLFEQAIEEDGRTRVLDRYTVSAPVTARLARITLHEGDRVATGDAVATLTPVMSAMVDERGTREATARLMAAGAGVERAGARVARARVAQAEAQLEMERATQLAAQGFVSASRLDGARLAVAAARRELDIAQAEHEMARQEQAQAAAALQPATGGAGRPLVVRAPVAGVVLRVAQPSEATVAAGTALLDIGDPTRMEVVAELLTTDAVQATAGRPVVIDRWGGPALQGRVRRVEPAAFTKLSALGIEEQRVRVLIDLASPPEAWHRVGDGFRVAVRIVTRSEAQALLVPVGALFAQGDGWAVYRLDGQTARLQPVALVARNASDAWVRGGVSAGQPVVVYPPSGLSDGRRVRRREP